MGNLLDFCDCGFNDNEKRDEIIINTIKNDLFDYEIDLNVNFDDITYILR